MRKYVKLAVIFIILVVIVIVIKIVSEKVYLEKIKDIYYNEIKELIEDTEFNVLDVVKYEGKIGEISYVLDLGIINELNLKIEVFNIEDILKPRDDTYLEVNICDLELARNLKNRYNGKYTVINLVHNGNVTNELDSKYTGVYKFTLKNIETGNLVTGLIPSNKNLDEMFDVNEREDLDFEF